MPMGRMQLTNAGQRGGAMGQAAAAAPEIG